MQGRGCPKGRVRLALAALSCIIAIIGCSSDELVVETSTAPHFAESGVVGVDASELETLSWSLFRKRCRTSLRRR